VALNLQAVDYMLVYGNRNKNYPLETQFNPWSWLVGLGQVRSGWSVRPISPFIPYIFTLPPFMLVSCLAYSSTLKMEATCCSEMSVDFQWTTRHYIPEHRTLLKNI
jgi:hypothetical protein